MKQVKYVGHQGDVAIFEVDEFPAGERVTDKQTENGELAYGELSGHVHQLERDTDTDVFKMNIAPYTGLIFFETKSNPITLRHGLIKGWDGIEPDKDYHSVVTLEPNKKYVTGIVQETDWVNKVIRQVAD